MAHFLHICVEADERQIDPEIINNVLNNAKDWAFYSKNCWIVWTNLALEEWYKRIRKVVQKNDTILILEVNIANRRGWISKDIAEWLSKDRSIDLIGE